MRLRKTIKTALVLLALLTVFGTATASSGNSPPKACLNTRSTWSDFGAAL